MTWYYMGVVFVEIMDEWKGWFLGVMERVM